MKASVFIATTLDGFIAREDGGLDWLPGSDGEVSTGSENEDFGFNAFMGTIDVLIMGRKTYELAISAGLWPYGDKRVVVLSNTLPDLPDGAPSTVELKSGTPRDLYRTLRSSGAKHLCVDGGKTIHGFLEAGLIDEMIITRVPVLIGTGIPLFGPLNNDKNLRHIETKAYESGFVQTRYAVVNEGTYGR